MTSYLCLRKLAICVAVGTLSTLSVATAQQPLPVTPTASLTLSRSHASLGVLVQLTASLEANAAPVYPGLMTFNEGKTVLGTGQLQSNGTASINVRLAVGTHQLTASFTPTTAFAAAVSAPQTLVVTGVVPATATVSSVVSGSGYTLTGSVAGDGLTVPTGTISFIDQTTNNVLATLPVGTPVATQTFRPQSVLGSGLSPVGIVVSDFNRDGAPDIAVANTYSNTVCVRLGKGDGTFGPEMVYHTGAGLDSIVTADFNGDGIPDLAVGNWQDTDVRVLLGKGDGTFSVQSPWYYVGLFVDSKQKLLSYRSDRYGPSPLMVWDFNGDGLPDIETAARVELDPYTSAGTLSRLIGNGDGTFQPQTIVGNGYDDMTTMAIADFLGTGQPSLITGFDYQPIHVTEPDYYANVSDVGRMQLNGYLTSIAIGDLNGDGVPDVAISQNDSVFVQLMTRDTVNANIKVGFGAQATYITGNSGVAGIVTGDFNGDGILDLAVGDYTYAVDKMRNEVSVLFGNGDGTFQKAFTYPVGLMPSAIAVGDFNRDGVVDMVVANKGDNTLSVLLGQVTQTVSAMSGAVTLSGTGTHQVVVVYSGDANHHSTTSTPIALQGN